MRIKIKEYSVSKVIRMSLFRFGVLVALVMPATGGLAEGAGERYYSIHLASFKYLQNANRHVNSLQEKGKLVFWKEVDIPGKGIFYRVFLGKYATREAAVRFWEKLNQEGAVSYFGVYEFKESVASLKPPELSIEKPLPPTEQPPASKPTTPRFVDNQNGTVTDTQTGLMWVKNGWRLDFVSALTWSEAMEKCRNFNLGGHTDWRLSSVDEWKTLIETERQAPALVEPNPFENIIIHMPYWSQSEFAVSGGPTIRPDPPSARAYTVMLYTGEIHHQKKSDRAFVMPVRVNK
ncbi:MAG: DUF1566 domain-containing protein [Desulfobacterales bacterium]|nr:DUF1566 domain-containing protein [Desulfobacterales bacterium]